MSSPNPQVEIWLKQGIDAARAGDKATARTMLERVVEQDQRSEKGWFWLAAVVDDISEKKICLGNVLTINPNNERAQNLLQRLQAIEQGAPPPQTGRPSPAKEMGAPTAYDDRTARLEQSRRDNHTVWYIAAGLGGIATIVLVVVLVMMMGGNGDSDQNAEPSGVGLNPTMSGNATAPDNPPPAIQPTLSPNVTPTASRTPLPAPPTWTPIPSNTPISATRPTPLPPAPANLGGKIIMRSGDVPSDPNNQPITIINPDGANRQTITGTERGHTPWLSPDGNRFVYIKYAVGTREYLLEFDNLQGTAPQFGTDYWGHSTVLLNPEQPTWSLDGNFIAFTAKGGSATADLYRLSLLDPTGATPDALQRLTNDNAIESWPAFSPDGQSIVYAADLSAMDMGTGTELRIYTISDGTIRNLTTNKTDLTEAAPDWSPDAAQIVFQAREANGTTADIYLIPAIGGEAQKIIDTDFDDIQPRFSPNGRYIVFSSNRSGNWDVFVYEIATQTLYQVTTDTFTDIANDWGN
jgi:Tol biopolymer transport system component